MNRMLLSLCALLLVGIVVVFGRFTAANEGESIENTEQTETVITTPKAEVKGTYTIEDGDTFAAMMEQMGYSYEQMQAVLDAGEDIYDFTSIVAGKNFVVQNSGGVYDEIVYDINSEEQAIISQNDAGAFVVIRQDIAYDIEIVESRGIIESSLFVDGNAAGLEDRTILDIADVFAWEIDFATVIQKGDRFGVVYEKRTRDGAPAPAGRVLAASFINSGKEFTGVRFEDPDGGVGYYTTDGESLQKPFLKAPLRYSRISSGFSYARFHPVTQQTGTHLAIDYAAPIGTPILATGDGKVTAAYYNGGYGNFISIRHNDTWTTQYAHLSGYAVSSGARVEQGDVIGYVGSTGWSTGPHLHYEMIKNGTKVNPLTVEMPAGEPIAEQWREDFYTVKSAFESFFAG